jgi:Calx-beta domain
MSRNALALLAVVITGLAVAPAAQAAGEGCTSVSVKGPKSVPEGAGTAQFSIAAAELAPPPAPPPPPPPPPLGASFRRTFSTACTVTVDYATVDGSAQAGADYSAVTGSVDLAPGEKANIDVPVIDDASDEPDEGFSLQTSDGTATTTIVDDDAPPTLTVTAAPVTEGAGAEVFAVSLSTPSGFPVSARYATADGSAKAGSDYTPESGTVTFPPGATTETVSVPLVNDSVHEGDESFALVLTAPQDATVGPAGPPAVVHDDDSTTQGGSTGSTAPTLVPSLDRTPPHITVPPGEQSGNAVVFTVSCPASEQLCTGRVRLDLLGGAAVAAARAKASLGSTSYRLKGGEHKKVKVKLNKRGTKLLKKRKKLRVKATFRTKDASANVATLSQILTLHAAAFRHS